MIEGVDGRMDCRFNRDDQRALSRFSDPLFKGVIICNEDLSISFHRKKEVYVQQNWAVGFTILELSKYVMQSTYYKTIKPAFKGQCSVLMSDTDSFVLTLPYKTSVEALKILHDQMDFSNYHPEHELYNNDHKNALGYLKNEISHDEISEFVGVKSKVYAITTHLGELQSKAKGVKKAYKKNLPFSNFKECVFTIRSQEVSQSSITSKNHQNMIILSKRVAFTSFDDKRYLLCNIHSVPYGSKLIAHYKSTHQCVFCNHPNLYV